MNRNILYIEDHPDNMTLIRRVLSAGSYNLIEAKTGWQGIHIAETQDVDMILLDINLPDIDGYEVAQRLRNSENPKLARVPIIAVTANAMRGDAIRILGAGCDYYISKPIDIHELLEKIEMYTKDRVILRTQS
ncbi:MAG: response regulator [Chloroflexi bacterium]|nr:response regulator [Chloroflexota bacterium]